MISFRGFRVWSSVVVLCAAAGVVGCSAQSTSSNGAESVDVAAQDVSSANRGGKGHGRRGGPEFLAKAALDELDLSAAQRTTIEGALHKNAPAPKEHRGAPPAFAALAEGVRSGKIDEAAILAKAGTGDPGMEAHRAAEASVLDTLHATLTKEQRRALVDAVNKHMDEHGPPGGPGGHHPGGEGEHGPKAGRDHGGPLGHMLSGLDLTDAQRTAIDQALQAQKPAAPDHEEMKKHIEAFRTEMRARLETFASDSFDAKAFTAPPAGAEAHGPKEGLARMIKDFSVIVPLLQPAQRETLAANLEKGPPAMGPHGAPPNAPEE